MGVVRLPAVAAASVALCLSIAGGCSDDVQNETTSGPTCADPPCEDECADPPCDDECADPPCDDECADPPCDDECADPPCDPPALAFQHVPIEIDDPIVNGTSLMLPIDGVSYAASSNAFVTSFGRGFDDPTQTFVWHLDPSTGTHSKKPLAGDVFAQSENFCVDEDWCQFIHYDEAASQWLVVGPAAANLMRVSSDYTATLSAVSGTSPRASLINHSHRFAGNQLFQFGATGPSGFDDAVHALDLTTGVWREAATGLAPTDENCLAFDAANDTLYSVGGRTTTDGGNTTSLLASMQAIDVGDGNATVIDLPMEIGARQGMSCVFDDQRNLLYAFGGVVIADRFNDALNTFHNDLWVFDPATTTWTNVIADTTGGTLSDPDMYGDQRFEGTPSGPNFGKNRGHMQLDTNADRLVVVGAVPIFTHGQLYVMPLKGIEQSL